MKISKTSIVSMLLFTGTLIPSLTFASIDINLRYGSQGTEVTELQEFLIDKGFLSGQATGNFFTLTKKAVIAYQTSIGLPATGFVGPMTRDKINPELFVDTTPEIKETGSVAVPAKNDPTTTLQKQIDDLLIQLKQLNARVQTQTATQQQTAPQQTIQNAVSSPSIPITSASQSETLEISSVIVVPEKTSTRFEWQTNKPTSGKVFISGGSLSSSVYGSESGLSTRHVVNATGLSSGTNYSYEIEAIAGGQVTKKQGSFITNPDEQDILIQVDRSSVQLTDWNSVNITAQYTKNGKLAPVDITFSAPGESKTYKIISLTSRTEAIPCNRPFYISIPNQLGGECSIDAKVSYNYKPKVLGKNTITVTANGFSKSVEIQATSYNYEKIDAKFERQPIYQQDANEVRRVVDTPILIRNSDGAVAVFKITAADEPFNVSDIKIESDISLDKFQKRVGAYPCCYNAPTNNNGETTYSIWFMGVMGDIVAGVHTVTVKEITVTGQNSGSKRQVVGLPATFTFEIKDIQP